MSNVRLPLLNLAVRGSAPDTPESFSARSASLVPSARHLGSSRAGALGAPELPGSGELVEGTDGTAVAEIGEMQVGDLARESGKTVRAIHLYEQMDLLKPARRSKGRYRLYGPEALVRIRWIQKLQDLGFSLTDIKAIVKDVEQHGSASSAMVGVREVYAKKLNETRTQIARLQELEHEILASLQYLEACDSLCERDRLLPTCQCCDHHPAEQEVPDLVAGFRS
jgi:DNA-binding transcriptional MerR regulator